MNKKSDKIEYDQEKAKILSEYFASMFVKEPPGNYQQNGRSKISYDAIEHRSQTTIYEILNKLKPESSAVDNYHPKCLTRMVLCISGPLSMIYQNV